MGTELVFTKPSIRSACIRDSNRLGVHLLVEANGHGRENKPKGMIAFGRKESLAW
jgi:hypothetical protein